MDHQTFESKVAERADEGLIKHRPSSAPRYRRWPSGSPAVRRTISRPSFLSR